MMYQSSYEKNRAVLYLPHQEKSSGAFSGVGYLYVCLLVGGIGFLSNLWVYL